MKVAFLTRAGLPLEIRKISRPKPKAHEIQVKIHYAALNHRDLWMILGQYRGKSENLILGSDGSGWIDALGEGVLGWEIGEPVLINPSLYWGQDQKVQGKEFQILGNPDPGTFSEWVIVPEENVFPIPKGLKMEEAAALPLSGLTAYRALFTRGNLKKGDSILITGIGGGTAQMALQMCIAAGARVYVSSSSRNKIDHALKLGAINGYIYSEPEWVNATRLDVPEGFDLILDSSAGKGFSDLIEVCKPGGNLVFFGGTAGPLGPILPAKVFWKQINILGTTMGTPQEFKELIQYYEEYKLVPALDSIYPLEDINSALEKMKSGEQMGKIILKIGK